MTKNPPKPLKASDNVKDFLGLTHYAPEIFLYYEKYGYELPDMTLDDIWGMFDSGKFSNDTIYQDIFLKKFEEEDFETYGFFDEHFYEYAKFLAIEEGLKFELWCCVDMIIKAGRAATC